MKHCVWKKWFCLAVILWCEIAFLIVVTWYNVNSSLSVPEPRVFVSKRERVRERERERERVRGRERQRKREVETGWKEDRKKERVKIDNFIFETSNNYFTLTSKVLDLIKPSFVFLSLFSGVDYQSVIRFKKCAF